MIHTHYDNLKVARNAPLSVIRAAYKALAQQYHPDKNPSPDAKRVMQLLNNAWEVLSDEARRAEHDAWIAEQESGTRTQEPRWQAQSNNGKGEQQTSERPKPAEQTHAAPRPRRKGYEAPPESPRREGYTQESESTGSQRWLVGVALLGMLFGLAYCNDQKRPASPVVSPPPAVAPIPATALPPTSSDPALFAAPDNAPPTGPRHFGAQDVAVAASTRWSPNGKPFPAQAGYLSGMPRGAQGGLSRVTIDNTRGGSDVYVKLCEAFEERCVGLRHVFIGRGETFSLNGIRQGVYDIRYRNLSSGRTAKSEPMTLDETEMTEGTRYSTVRLTLYTLKDGNSRHSSIPEEQF